MVKEINRRKFLGSTAAAAAAFTIVPRHVLGGPGFIPPSDKITVASVGFGTQAIRSVSDLLTDPTVQMTAVCDVEKDGVNYLEWGKGGVRNVIRGLLEEPEWRAGKDWTPGGRDVGKELFETYYKKHGSNQVVNTYIDFREMLEKEKDLDAVKVMTADHAHSMVALAALRKGKSVLMHKPLSNRLMEGRLVIDTARKMNIKTHFMAANERPTMPTIKSWIDQDAIGTLREIQVWSMRPVWPQYATMPTDKPPIPKDFNWELWQAQVPERPYHPWYTHTTFRGWYDYGGGALPDMGHHCIWPIFMAFDLDAAHCIETTISEVCQVTDGNICTKIRNDFSFPFASTARMQFKAKGSRPAIDIVWHDGGAKPPTPPEYRAEGKELNTEGVLFIGDKGKILTGFDLESPRIIPESKMTEFRKGRNIAAPEPLVNKLGMGVTSGGGAATAAPRATARGGDAAGQQNALIAAIKSGKPSFGDFTLCQPILETFTLVPVSYRLGGKRLLWDTVAGKITNIPEANKYLTREYRKGWEMA